MTLRKPPGKVTAAARTTQRKGDDMAPTGDFKILFIAGFGPIVREVNVSRKLYSEILGIQFKEESGEYLHTEAMKGANSFALWPLSHAAQSCFGKDSWPDEIPAPQPGLSSMSIVSKRRRLSLWHEAIECS